MDFSAPPRTATRSVARSGGSQRAGGCLAIPPSFAPDGGATGAISGTAFPSPSTVTFTVNANASGLAAGTYGPFAITFTNSDTGQGTQTRTATLTVNPPPSPALQVIPTSNIFLAGNQGALPPSSFPYALSATTSTINYSISGVPNWLTPSSTSGNVSSPGTTVTFTVNANANSLAPGTYGPTTITFTSGTGQGTQTRTATLTVNPPALQVTPASGSTASGTHGGSFSPSSFRYSLNSTFGSVKYSITAPSWLTASPVSATVTTSARTITFTVNSKARSLGPGTYTDNIGFNNTTNKSRLCQLDAEREGGQHVGELHVHHAQCQCHADSSLQVTVPARAPRYLRSLAPRGHDEWQINFYVQFPLPVMLSGR